MAGMLPVMAQDDDFGGPGSLDKRLRDLDWRERTGDDPERVYREAMRRALALREGGLRGRVTILVDVLNRLGELLALDGTSVWDRD
jgi:hypothetical protein